MNAGNLGMQAGTVDFLATGPFAQRAEQLTKMAPTILKEAQKAAQGLVSVLIENSGDDTGPLHQRDEGNPLRPRLTPPKAVARTATKLDKDEEASVQKRSAYMLLAEMMEVLERSSLNKLALNAQFATVRDAMREGSSRQLADMYDAKVESATARLAELTAIVDRLKVVNETISALDNELRNAEQALANAVAGSSEHTALSQRCEELRRDLALAKGEKAQLEAQLIAAKDAYGKVQSEVDDLFAQAEKLNVPVSGQSVKKDQSNMARMLTLMSLLGELLLKNGEIRGETQRSLLKLQEDIRLKKIIKDADKADREMRKAEIMSKTMGCIGKIVGAIVTVIGVAGALFSGGASLALAGIGLTLMLSDQIYSSVTGKSFMAEAMKPIMKLLQPILQFVMDKISGALEKFGVDAQTSKMIAMVAVSIAIAVAAAVAAFTGVGGAISGAVSNLLSKMSSVMTKVLETTIGRMIKALLTSVARSASKMGSKVSSANSKVIETVSRSLGLGTDNVSRQVYAQQLMRTAMAVNLGKTVVNGGLDIGVQVANREVAKAVASMKFAMAEIDLINDMFANVLEQFKSAFTLSEGFFSRASEAISQHTSAGSAVARAIHGSRSA